MLIVKTFKDPQTMFLEAFQLPTQVIVSPIMDYFGFSHYRSYMNCHVYITIVIF